MTKALFLDRDGVINIDTGYVHKIDGYEFQEGIFALCRWFQKAGYLIIVVTNQSGVARGYFTEEDYYRLNDFMLSRFREEGVEITRVYSCFHHPDGREPYNKECENRKPGPGSFMKARDEFHIDMAESLMIGDRPSDIIASSAAGVGKNFILKGLYDLKDIPVEHVLVESLGDVLSAYRSLSE